MASDSLLRSTAVALLVVLAVPSVAWAGGPSPAEKETARTLMSEGRMRRGRNDHEGALQSFRAADAIMHVPTTGLEVARSEVAMGRLVEARDTLRRVLRIPVENNEPKVFREARAQATALDDEVAVRIPTVRVVLTGADPGGEGELEVDDMKLPQAALQAPLRLNPGVHRIAVHAPRASGSGQVQVAEREARTLEIALVAAPLAPPTDTAPPPTAPVADAPAARPFRTVGIVSLGVGGAALVAGAITGGLSLAATSRAKGQCVNNECPPAAESDLATAHTTATASTVCFVAAGAFVTAGVLALVFGDKPPPQAGKAHVEPWVGAGSAGLSGRF